MQRLDEKQRERLRTLLVEILMEFRKEYLRTPQAKTLEHWRILLDRMQASARCSRNADEWATQTARWLQIPQLGSSTCSALLELSHFVRELEAWPEMRHVIDRERGLLEALGRQMAEQRKAAREEVTT